MVDASIAQIEVVVTGGPREVKVDADFGPQGQRGSLLLYGYGAPEDNVRYLTQVPQILDWYINLSPSHPEYLYMYQYVDQDSGFIWKPFIKLFPNTYNTNVQVTFVDGTATFDLNIGNASLPYLLQLMGNDSEVAQQFNIQLNIPNAKPVAASIYFGTSPDAVTAQVINENYEYVVPVKIHAAELTGSTWSGLTGQKTAQISINMI